MSNCRFPSATPDASGHLYGNLFGVLRAALRLIPSKYTEGLPGWLLKGVYNTLMPVIPKMYERGEGSVVCISSISGERGNLGQTNYAASKAAVIGLTKSLAREAARYGVRVNAVSPGFIETDMVKSVPDKVKERIVSEIPLGRFGKPEEIAWAVAFLLLARQQLCHG